MSSLPPGDGDGGGTTQEAEGPTPAEREKVMSQFQWTTFTSLAEQCTGSSGSGGMGTTYSVVGDLAETMPGREKTMACGSSTTTRVSRTVELPPPSVRLSEESLPLGLCRYSLLGLHRPFGWMVCMQVFTWVMDTGLPSDIKLVAVIVDIEWQWPDEPAQVFWAVLDNLLEIQGQDGVRWWDDAFSAAAALSFF
ncbi:hypothetical protein Salat_0668700 [Sesamum alatum]|uniref:Uncharacterized protein n=1 Tax=Sesamum alatum TaxID=300844 RepID=A0AAE1YRR8_9LAMI|nr:hypothetical protein Salat_0668700 [Sesamum alatum]